MRRLLIVIVLAVPLGGPLRGADVEQEARELEAKLIAPCCFTQQVSVHHSAAADEARADIRVRLLAGETHEQILAAYVARYGKRVLAEPPARGFDVVLHVLPPIVMGLTAAFVLLVIRRYTRRPGSDASADERPGQSADDRYSAEIDEQLRELD